MDRSHHRDRAADRQEPQRPVPARPPVPPGRALRGEEPVRVLPPGGAARPATTKGADGLARRPSSSSRRRCSSTTGCCASSRTSTTRTRSPSTWRTSSASSVSSTRCSRRSASSSPSTRRARCASRPSRSSATTTSTRPTWPRPRSTTRRSSSSRRRPVHDLARYKLGWIRVNQSKFTPTRSPSSRPPPASEPIAGVDQPEGAQRQARGAARPGLQLHRGPARQGRAGVLREALRQPRHLRPGAGQAREPLLHQAAVRVRHPRAAQADGDPARSRAGPRARREALRLAQGRQGARCPPSRRTSGTWCARR